MKRDELKRIISNVKLIGGEIELAERCNSRWSTSGQLLELQLSIFVQSREDRSKKIVVVFEQVISDHELAYFKDETDALRWVQKVWTGLWMHESLETFLYKDELVFDPHCPTRITPISGDFSLNDQCRVIEKSGGDNPK